MTTYQLAENLAKRVRAAAGRHDDIHLGVEQIVSGMAERIAELETELRAARADNRVCRLPTTRGSDTPEGET